MKRILGIFAGLSLAASLFAGGAIFDFKDPSGVSNLKFDMTAPVESISGTADGITGSVHFDAAHPGETKGSLVVSTSSIMVPKSKMREHIMGAMWMDAKKYPELKFELTNLADVKDAGDGTFKGKAKGVMTLKGVAQELDAVVTIKHLVGKLGAKLPGKKGDLLVVSGTLVVNRDDFNINAGQKLDKVANDIHIALNLVGYAEM